MDSQSAVPLLSELPLPEKRGGGLAKKVWEESKKLGEVVGPAVFMNLVFSTIGIVSQSFAGHLGDLDLAAYAMANTVVDGFNFATLLGMANALETLCGQAYEAKQYHMLGIYVQRSWLVLLAFAVLPSPMEAKLYFFILLRLLLRIFVNSKDFVTLSAASGVMLCLESWYYRVLVFLTGYTKNAELAMDALSICMSLVGWEMMIHLGFLAGTGVRVANELGANNGRGARFATIVSATTSFLIGLFISLLTLIFHDKLAIMFTSSEGVINVVDNISVLLALTILLNGIQPVLSGVAVGSGWQALVAYVNVGSYYLMGVPFGVLLAWVFHYGVLVRIFRKNC